MNTIKSLVIEGPFKGSRDYLHSTDIYNQLLAAFPKTESLELHFFKKLTHPTLLEKISGQFDKTKWDGYVELSLDNQRNSFGLLQDKTQWVQEKIPYDENRVIVDATVKETAIYLDADFFSDFTPIEIVVALNKHLLFEILSPTVKWAVTRVQVTTPLVQGKYKLILEKNLGVHLTKSAIYIDNQHYGYIYFSDFAGAFPS